MIHVKIKRIYHPYWLWEDHKSGMYEITRNYSEDKEAEMAIRAKNLLSNPTLFEEVALKVISEWKHSTEVNLSNKGRNRQAWIGQASCCYAYKIPEHLTKYGWRLMSLKQQIEANKIADKVIEKWESDYKRRKNTSLTTF